MDYEQMAEPNMKLSRALLIVLVLHIVAVAGIIAFNTIKTRESMTPNAPRSGRAGHGRRRHRSPARNSRPPRLTK